MAGGGALPSLFARRARAQSIGPLVPDPDGILDLPEGFTYTILDRKGDEMNDGFTVPGRPDGMAAFALGGGQIALMRNHELSRIDVLDAAWGPFGAPDEAFDGSAYGGVTRLVIDPQTLEVVSSNLTIAGTIRNCAGGPSPWGWLTCEEDVSSGHGYVFAAPADADSVRSVEPIRGYGRFNHRRAPPRPRPRAPPCRRAALPSWPGPR